MSCWSLTDHTKVTMLLSLGAAARRVVLINLQMTSNRRINYSKGNLIVEAVTASQRICLLLAAVNHFLFIEFHQLSYGFSC